MLLARNAKEGSPVSQDAPKAQTRLDFNAVQAEAGLQSPQRFTWLKKAAPMPAGYKEALADARASNEKYDTSHFEYDKSYSPVNEADEFQLHAELEKLRPVNHKTPDIDQPFVHTTANDNVKNNQRFVRTAIILDRLDAQLAQKKPHTQDKSSNVSQVSLPLAAQIKLSLFNHAHYIAAFLTAVSSAVALAAILQTASSTALGAAGPSLAWFVAICSGIALGGIAYLITEKIMARNDLWHVDKQVIRGLSSQATHSHASTPALHMRDCADEAAVYLEKHSRYNPL